MDRETIVEAFTQQAETFNATAALSSEDALGRLVELLPAERSQRWLDAACGPGLVARALAPRVGHVHGVDVTPAMLEVATRETARAGLANVAFTLADVTALPFADGSFDGAVTRFSLHHIPLPGRVVSELARVVRAGGVVAVADHVTSDDPDLAAWHEELERLRDPTHWACLTRARLLALGEAAGLELAHEEQRRFALDFDDWIARGTRDEGSRALVEQALALRPAGTDPFPVTRAADGRRVVTPTLQLVLWRRR